MVQRAPNYPYMFSELPHFPATSYKCVPYMGANAYRLVYWALEGMSTRWHDHERSHAPHSRMSMSMDGSAEVEPGLAILPPGSRTATRYQRSSTGPFSLLPPLQRIKPSGARPIRSMGPTASSTTGAPCYPRQMSS